jgi:hypothetical protein
MPDIAPPSAVGELDITYSCSVRTFRSRRAAVYSVVANSAAPRSRKSRRYRMESGVRSTGPCGGCTVIERKRSVTKLPFTLSAYAPVISNRRFSDLIMTALGNACELLLNRRTIAIAALSQKSTYIRVGACSAGKGLSAPVRRDSAMPVAFDQNTPSSTPPPQRSRFSGVFAASTDGRSIEPAGSLVGVGAAVAASG